MNTDPIADCFSRLRNGAKARKDLVNIPYSRMKEQILKLLKDEGFVSDVYTSDVPGRRSTKRQQLVVRLKYESNGGSVLEHIRRVSKPGHRVYQSVPNQGSVRGGLGFRIYSTSKGILTDKQAHEMKTGGELLGEVW